VTASNSPVTTPPNEPVLGRTEKKKNCTFPFLSFPSHAGEILHCSLLQYVLRKYFSASFFYVLFWALAFRRFICSEYIVSFSTTESILISMLSTATSISLLPVPSKSIIHEMNDSSWRGSGDKRQGQHPPNAKPIFPRIILQLYLPPHRFYLILLYILVPPFMKKYSS